MAQIKSMNTNLLVSYEILPSSMLYLVYNQPRNIITNEFDNIYMLKISNSLRF